MSSLKFVALTMIVNESDGLAGVYVFEIDLVSLLSLEVEHEKLKKVRRNRLNKKKRTEQKLPDTLFL